VHFVANSAISAPLPRGKPRWYSRLEEPPSRPPVLNDASELAYKMGDTPKPDLVDLMNLFLGWGFSILYLKWLDHSGYK